MTTYAIFGTDHEGRPDGFMYLIDANTKRSAFRHYDRDVDIVKFYNSFEEARDNHVIRIVPDEHHEDWKDASGLYSHPTMDTLA